VVSAKEERMSRSVFALSAGILAAILIGPAFMVSPVVAEPTSDATKDATAKCRAQVKEQAQFQEMSLYARHKAVKKCVADILAGH
jgi:hypothetical protein